MENNNKTEIELFDVVYDHVVKSIFCIGKTTYEYAYSNFYPQIDKYYAQRKRVDEKFYKKLERDIATGCIMPPITVAIVLNSIDEFKQKSKEELQKLLLDSKNDVYILDGIQRLNTLYRAFSDGIKSFPIFFNLLISDSEDRLLYRMITLNNGQKPMSPRHQIEVLAHNIFEFDDLNITIQTEKERSKKKINGSFNKDDIIKGYISYLSESTNIDNQKIIESKMDELIAEKIIESDVTQNDTHFTEIIENIDRFITEPDLLKWFKQSNNLIGYCAGISKSYKMIHTLEPEDFKNSIDKFEEAFRSFDISKIKLGNLRRLTVNQFISKFETLKDSSVTEIEDQISTAADLYLL